MTKTQATQHPQGITLLELTVVILVMLTLISILFVGTKAWKRGADRSNNILNLRNAQQAMRGHSNVRGLQVGDPILESEIFGLNAYLTFPAPIATVIYSVPIEEVTPFGILYLQASPDGAPAPRATPTIYGPYTEDIIEL